MSTEHASPSGAASESGAAPSRSPPRPSGAEVRFLVAAGLVLSGAVVLTHWPGLSARALFFDDVMYLSGNPRVLHPTWSDAWRLLAEVTEPTTIRGYYEPLPILTLMLDSVLGGSVDDLGPYHRTALLLHVANTLLVAGLVYLLFGRAWVAAMVGLLFGLHPLQVESTVWLSQRKTLLGTFFAMWGLILYVRYARRGGWGLYGVCLGTYVLALMSKPTTVPLPAAMLVMDYWPLRRLGRRSALEKVPFFILGGVSALVVIVSQGRTAQLDMPGQVGWARIPLILCHNVVFYLRKIVCPTGLSAYYPFPEPLGLSHPAVLAGVVGTGVLILVLLASLRWTRAVLAGWLFFFLAIFPTMGIVKFTPVIAADRFVYLPLVGLLLPVAWALARLWPAAGRVTRLDPRQLAAVAVVGVLALAAALATRDYLSHWQDKERIFRRMLSFAPDEPTLHNGLGNALIQKGRVAAGIEHFRKVVELEPDSASAWKRLAAAQARQGAAARAVASYEAALRLDPDAVQVHFNLGNLLVKLKRWAEATDHYTAALGVDPDLAEAHHNLAVALTKLGKLAAAVGHYTEAIRLDPDFVTAHWNLGAALIKQGKLDEAIEIYRRAARLRPKDPDAHFRLGLALSRGGRLAEARASYRRALELDPAHAGARRALTGRRND